MNRRDFLLKSAAAALVGCAPAPLLAQGRFRPTRFSVAVEGPPRGRDVILIPGLASGRAVWRRIVEAVPGHRYHLLQIGGFAGEPVRGNADGWVVRGVAEELARYIEAEGLRRPAIVGHSMGGTIGMMVAARHPQRVGRLMIVDMLPRPTALFGSSGELLAGLAGNLGGFASDPAGRQLLGSLVSAFSPPADRGSNGEVVARAMQELGTTDLSGELSAIRAPTTIVYAVQDNRLMEATARNFTAAYRRVPQARFVPMPESSHAVMLDQPGRFAAALRDFLDR